jgi:hypothetical protein
MERAVIGIVDTPLQANTAVERLRDAGFGSSDISLLYPDRHGTHDFGFEHRSKAPEGAVFGVVAGAILGAALGMVAGVGVLAVPGFAVLTAAGPLLAMLAGAAALAIPLGILGALAGSWMPEIEARHYAGKTKFGSILVAVHTDRRRERRVARDILREIAASDITMTPESSVPISARLEERPT